MSSHEVRAQAEVRAQYEAYPYPERNPKDESKRLITGSPSLPTEMDHWLWGGARDWTQPLNALVAGGGTGDGLIQLAQMLTSAGRPYRITYLDMSVAARKVAQQRAEARGLEGIDFVTGSLLDARDYGDFDYIDCCGVLHHLDNPQAGFDALAAALAPEGGLGCMVYAPLGRSGVYPLQSAFRALLRGLAPAERLARAKAIFKTLPVGHPFKCNPHLMDHEHGDAGFYDLLLHGCDQPFSIAQLIGALENAGLELAGTPVPALYDPASLIPARQELPEGLSQSQRMAIAEDLRGTFKKHVVYAKAKGTLIAPPFGKDSAVPHLRGVPASRLARAVEQNGSVKLDASGETITFSLPKSSVPLIAAIDGRRSLATIREHLRMDVIGFSVAWAPAERVLCGIGQMHYSNLLGKRAPSTRAVGPVGQRPSFDAVPVSND